MNWDSPRALSQELANLLSQRATTYFPELVGLTPQVRLLACRKLQFSWIRDYAIAVGNASSRGPRAHAERRVVVKVPRAPRRVDTPDDPLAAARPRLIPPVALEREPALEFGALTAIASYVAKVNDRRLRAVQVLDLIDRRAIVYGANLEPTLRAQLKRFRRWHLRGRGPELTAAFRNSGVWLRTLHGMRSACSPGSDCSTRDDAVALARRYGKHLAALTGGDAAWEGLADRMADWAANALPDALPQAVLHGDFAPHNLFVGPGCRVAAFDTLLSLRAPVYVDIAWFLFTLKAQPPWNWGADWVIRVRDLATFEDAFLDGYFDGDLVPRGTVQWFELLVLLDKWTSMAHRLRRATGAGRLAKRCRSWLEEQFFRRYRHDLVVDLESSISSGGDPGPSESESGETLGSAPERQDRST